MTTETTLPPPKEKPWLKCNTEGCGGVFQVYHGKVGCLCDECERIRDDGEKGGVYEYIV